MRLNPAGDQDVSSFQLAPMIDIVFTVLIFFVTTYAVSREEKMLGLNLPVAASGEAEFHRREQIFVNLNAKGEIFVQSRALAPTALERILAQMSAFASEQNPPAVVIRADGDCPHRFVVQVMDMCARAGIANVHFSAVPAPAE